MRLYFRDKSTEKNSAKVIQSSKISHQLMEISGSLKLLGVMPLNIVKQIVEVEAKTPNIHLKLEHVEDPQEPLRARSTWFKFNYLELITHN